MRKFIAVAALCTAAWPALAQDVAGARDASAKFTAALASGDAGAAAAYLADDAVILPPGRQPIDGKAQAQRFLGNMTRVVKNLKYTPEDVKPVGDGAAREVGTFSFKLRDKDVDGKYLLVWTKVGPDWKLAADMWNRSGGGRGGPGANGMPGRRGANGGNGQNGGNGPNGANGANGANGDDIE